MLNNNFYEKKILKVEDNSTTFDQNVKQKYSENKGITNERLYPMLFKSTFILMNGSF